MERALRLLWRWTGVCLGWAVAVIALWSVVKFSVYFARSIVVVFSAALVVGFSIVFWQLAREMTLVLERFRPGVSNKKYSPEIWKKQLEDFEPKLQAAILRRTTAGTFQMNVSDFLALLESIESSIAEEPALSAYWPKRYELEQIIYQEQSG